MELAKPGPHHHPFHFVRTFTFTTCQVTSPFHFGEIFKEQWAQGAHSVSMICFILCSSTAIHCFTIKRCSRGNYSVKAHLQSGGRLQRVISWNRNNVCRPLWEMPELLRKISHFRCHVNRDDAKQSQTDTQSCFMPKPSCQEVQLNLFPLTSQCGRKSQCHSLTCDYFGTLHATGLEAFVFRHIDTAATSSSFTSSSWTIRSFSALFPSC